MKGDPGFSCFAGSVGLADDLFDSQSCGWRSPGDGFPITLSVDGKVDEEDSWRAMAAGE